LVASYDLRPGNKASPYSGRKGIGKGKKKKKRDEKMEIGKVSKEK